MAIIECYTWEAFVDGRRFHSVRLLDSVSTATAGSCTHVLSVRSWLKGLLLFLAGIAEKTSHWSLGEYTTFSSHGMPSDSTCSHRSSPYKFLSSHGAMYSTETPPRSLDNQAMAAVTLLGLAL